jgi:hypothetical protein
MYFCSVTNISYKLTSSHELTFREAAFDSEENLLIEKSITSMEDSTRRKMAAAHNKFEDIFQMAKTFEEGLDILIQNLERLSLLFEPTSRARQEKQESFIGMSIPENVQVHPPSDIRSKGRCKRIVGYADKHKRTQSSGPRKCTSCKGVGHDRRNCPNKDAAPP